MADDGGARGGVEMGAQERAALALWLVSRRPMSTAAIARRLGMGRDGARVMLAKISRVVPLYYDDETGAWVLCSEGGDRGER